jgi:hypothetical protein
METATRMLHSERFSQGAAAGGRSSTASQSRRVEKDSLVARGDLGGLGDTELLAPKVRLYVLTRGPGATGTHGRIERRET